MYQIACDMIHEYAYFRLLMCEQPQWAMRETMRIRLESIKYFGY